MTGFAYNVIRFLVFTALMVSMASNIKSHLKTLNLRVTLPLNIRKPLIIGAVPLMILIKAKRKISQIRCFIAPNRNTKSYQRKKYLIALSLQKVCDIVANALAYQFVRDSPHEKINRCLTNINQCLTDIFKI